MGYTIAQKIIKEHLVCGEMVVGNDIGLRIDQTLTPVSYTHLLFICTSIFPLRNGFTLVSLLILRIQFLPVSYTHLG